MHLFIKNLIRFINSISEKCGQLVSWLVLMMVLIIVYDVMMRYQFQIGSVALQELEWHLFALLFLLGSAYTLKHDAHVRVDIVYQSRFFSDRHRAWVNILGTLFFLFPFSLLIILSSVDFISLSFKINEGSPDPGGLPYRFLLKLCIPIAFILLMLQGLALILESVVLLKEPSSQPLAKDSPSQGEAQ